MYTKLQLFTSVDMIDNIWVVNIEAFWDPPSNPIGEVTSYLVRLQYERSPGRFGSLRTSRISDPAVRQWKPDPIPSQRPLYFQVQSVEHVSSVGTSFTTRNVVCAAGNLDPRLIPSEGSGPRLHSTCGRYEQTSTEQSNFKYFYE